MTKDIVKEHHMSKSEQEKFFKALNECLSGALIGFSLVAALLIGAFVFALFL